MYLHGTMIKVIIICQQVKTHTHTHIHDAEENNIHM